MKIRQAKKITTAVFRYNHGIDPLRHAFRHWHTAMMVRDRWIKKVGYDREIASDRTKTVKRYLRLQGKYASQTS